MSATTDFNSVITKPLHSIFWISHFEPIYNEIRAERLQASKNEKAIGDTKKKLVFGQKVFQNEFIIQSFFPTLSTFAQKTREKLEITNLQGFR